MFSPRIPSSMGSALFGSMLTLLTGNAVGMGQGDASGISSARGEGLHPGPVWRAFGEKPRARFGSAVCASDVNGDGYADAIVGSPTYTNDEPEEGRVQIFLGGPDGLASKPFWSMEGDRPYAHLGYSVGGGGDVNGDGYEDVIVGAPAFGESGRPATGGVYVFVGGADGLGMACAFLGRGSGTFFGASVTLMGDSDGDGFGEMAFGEPGPGSRGGPGRFYYLDGFPWPSGPTDDDPIQFPLTSPWVVEGEGVGWCVAQAGDVNGDGRPDFLATRSTGVQVHLGSRSGIRSNPSWKRPLLGDRAVAARAGDVNGDGFDDVAFAGYSRGLGFVTVYAGARRGLARVPLWSTQLSDSVGTVAAAGDLDADGFDDLFVGGLSSGDLVGRARVFAGSVDGPGANPIRELVDRDLGWPDVLLGLSGGGLGDVDGDGYADLLIGAPAWSSKGAKEEGAVFLYEGNPEPTLAQPQPPR